MTSACHRALSAELTATSRRAAIVLVVALSAAAFPLYAQPLFPSRPVRIVVPFPPGGPADTLARSIAQGLSEKWGQPVIIDNRAGGNTVVGALEVAKAKPDGYTLLLTMDATFTMNAVLFSKLPYDPIADFAPVSIVARQSMVVMANSRTTVRSVPELVSLAKSQVDYLYYGSGAISAQVSGELFNRAAGVKLLMVPYKGAADSVKGLLSGDTQFSFDGIAPNLPHIESGRLRALATTGRTRAAALPEVPTLQELGYKDCNLEVWNGIAAPSKTPRVIIEKLHRDVADVTARGALRDKLRPLGFELTASTPEEMGVEIQRDTVRFAPLLKELGIRLD